MQTSHEGRKYVRKMYDSFELQGPHGTHICLVHQPLGISLSELKELPPDGLFQPRTYTTDAAMYLGWNPVFARGSPSHTH
jgi:hypothetical protein